MGKPKKPKKDVVQEERTMGERVSDRFAEVVGSWTFIIVQSCFLLAWIGINIVWAMGQWDPYPFILLNLFLSFQAAYTGPIIMMSQNRQAKIDRETMVKDYELSEESSKYLERIVKILAESKKDRDKQFALLHKLIEEMEEDDAEKKD